MAESAPATAMLLRAADAQTQSEQKMEAGGWLAGGISHDLDNLLSVILGNAELLLETTQSAAQRHYTEEIKKTTGSAFQLTRQLLADSRKHALRSAILNINEIVHDIEGILQCLMGKHVQILTKLTTDLGPIRADRGQVEQILMNLATNARDAMPGGGRFIIQTENAELSTADATCRWGINPGRYVRLSVSDTGVGMSEEIRARVFEPFFTTKPPGRGTGLGLATACEVVCQSGGYISISSAPGAGATFDVYVPRAD